MKASSLGEGRTLKVNASILLIEIDKLNLHTTCTGRHAQAEGTEA
jgi:hypothetical protein